MTARASDQPTGFSRVAVLGAGSWGTALAAVMVGCADVRLWARDPDLATALERDRQNVRYLPGTPLPKEVRPVADLEVALRDAEAVVFAVPSAGMTDVANAAAPLISRGSLLINASKGLEAGTGLRMSELILRALNQRPDGGSAFDIVAISGPNLAVEVARRLPTATVAASTSLEAARRCRRLWMGPALRIYTSADIVGVELAGAMKNVVAIGSGVCEGMGYGDNSRAALMTRGLAEITRLGGVLGADKATFLGLAGVGDLIATGGSKLSRNFRVGLGLGRGEALPDVLAGLGQAAEGVPTTRAICILAERYRVDMPVSRAIHQVLFEHAPVRRTISELMMRPPRDEG